MNQIERPCRWEAPKAETSPPSPKLRRILSVEDIQRNCDGSNENYGIYDEFDVPTFDGCLKKTKDNNESKLQAFPSCSTMTNSVVFPSCESFCSTTSSSSRASHHPTFVTKRFEDEHELHQEEYLRQQESNSNESWFVGEADGNDYESKCRQDYGCYDVVDLTPVKESGRRKKKANASSLENLNYLDFWASAEEEDNGWDNYCDFEEEEKEEEDIPDQLDSIVVQCIFCREFYHVPPNLPTVYCVICQESFSMHNDPRRTLSERSRPSDCSQGSIRLVQLRTSW